MEEMKSMRSTTDERNKSDNTNTENKLTLLSISDAEQLMLEWEKSLSSDKSLPERIVRAVDTSATIFGTSEEYHNLASEFARHDLYKNARIIAVAGAEKFKNDVDLLADIIRFGSKSDGLEESKNAYERLKEIDKSRWSWRAFTFSIDYLKDLIAIGDGDDEYYYNEAMTLAEEYKKQLNDERAWVAVAELHNMFGFTDKAISELKNGVEKVVVSPQCCLRLSDLLLKQGDYRGVIKYSAIGARATAQEQPSSSVGYLFYLSALAKDALIHQEELESPGIKGKGFSNYDGIYSALCDYDIALGLLGNMTYTKNILQRKLILHTQSGIKSDETSDSN